MGRLFVRGDWVLRRASYNTLYTSGFPLQNQSQRGHCDQSDQIFAKFDNLRYNDNNFEYNFFKHQTVIMNISQHQE